MRRFLDVVQQRAVYLWVLLSIPAVSTFGHYLAPNRPFFKGHDLGILAALTLTLVVALLWIPFKRRDRWPSATLIFLVLVGIAWAYQILRIQTDNSLFNLTAFVVPVALLLLAIKPMDRSDLRIGLLVLGYSLLTISAASLVLGSLGVVPSGFDVSDGGGSRIPIFLEWGITRWGGPFGSVNYAAPIGGLLTMIGLTTVGKGRPPLVFGGLLVLVLSQGRTALFAVLAAIIIRLLWSNRMSRLANIVAIRATAILGFLAVSLSYVLVFDPTLSYRTFLWSSYSPLFDDSPLIGIGDSGIREHVATQAQLPDALLHDHAHSVLLDAYVRFGLVLVLLGLAIYFIALRSSFRAIPAVGSGPLSLVVFVIVAGLAETIYSWNYWSVYTATLVWSVLVTTAPAGDTSGVPVTAGPISSPRDASSNHSA